eukprot:GDKH01018514.1.p2 GENE.GDKH01018514.1~~GDKH01018514.1.p2  ORF type:complete len:73 (-),score=2.20 GDKH01018514.1:87-305(-)
MVVACRKRRGLFFVVASCSWGWVDFCVAGWGKGAGAYVIRTLPAATLVMQADAGRAMGFACGPVIAFRPCGV